jgi:hypothetical protein
MNQIIEKAPETYQALVKNFRIRCRDKLMKRLGESIVSKRHPSWKLVEKAQKDFSHFAISKSQRNNIYYKSIGLYYGSQVRPLD